MKLEPISKFLDNLINLLKWPCAVVLLVTIPSGLRAWADLLGMVVSSASMPFLVTVLGCIVYVILWHLFFKRPGWGSLLSTFEHELTHAIFAWLTFHRVTGFKSTWKRGGSVTFLGKGNWLITLAPYFFPTLSVFVLVANALMPFVSDIIFRGVLGLTIGYHLTSTIRECHWKQPDFKKAGFCFAVVFLSVSNFLTLLFLFAYAYGGLSLVLGQILRIFSFY